MADFKHKEMEGSLFENSYKERDSHPDMKGTIVFNNISYSVAAWKNTTKSGGKYLKLKVSEPLESKRQDDPKPYHSVGDNFAGKSKHMKNYEKAQKEAKDIETIFNDEDIPF